MSTSPVLQPGAGPIRSATYLPATTEHVLWGRLPCATDSPALTVAPGTEVTVDTISHEGVLEDQGRDPRAFFGAHGVDDVLDDAVALAASDIEHRVGLDGPHVVSRPIAVEGARVGDLLAITVVETLMRVPYGVVSNRHGRGALPGEFPIGDAPLVSVFTPVSDDGTRGLLPLTEAAERTVSFPLAPFLGIMGVATAGDQRAHLVPPGPSARARSTSTTTCSPRRVPRTAAS